MRAYFVTMLLAVTVGGCVDDRPERRPGPPCSDCSNLGGPSGSGEGGGGAGGSGGAMPGTVTGSVLALTSPGFDQGVTYNGEASIIALEDLGDGPTVSYGGVLGTTFELTEIPGGDFWLYVQDETNGVNDVLSTFSRQRSPSEAAQAPLVTRELMVAVGQTLLPSQNVDSARAQLVLELRRADAPFVGATLVEPAFDGVVAYDDGPAGYDAAAPATGPFARILVMNMDVAKRSEITLAVQDDEGVFYPMDVVVAPGSATVAGFAFP